MNFSVLPVCNLHLGKNLVFRDQRLCVTWRAQCERGVKSIIGTILSSVELSVIISIDNDRVYFDRYLLLWRLLQTP